jgi:hypothetical protein
MYNELFLSQKEVNELAYEPKIISIYRAVKGIINTPQSCWKPLPKWMSIPVAYFDKKHDVNNCICTKFYELNNTEYYAIMGDVDDGNIILSHMNNPMDNKVKCMTLNYKYGLQELSYYSYIRTTGAIFKLIISDIGLYEGYVYENYIPYIMVIQLVKDTCSSVADIDKLLEDAKIKDIFKSLSEEKGLDIYELSKQLDDPINELIVNNGIYAIL